MIPLICFILHQYLKHQILLINLCLLLHYLCQLPDNSNDDDDKNNDTNNSHSFSLSLNLLLTFHLTGHKIMEGAAQSNLKRVTLELGKECSYGKHLNTYILLVSFQIRLNYLVHSNYLNYLTHVLHTCTHTLSHTHSLSLSLTFSHTHSLSLSLSPTHTHRSPI